MQGMLEQKAHKVNNKEDRRHKQVIKIVYSKDFKQTGTIN